MVPSRVYNLSRGTHGGPGGGRRDRTNDLLAPASPSANCLMGDCPTLPHRLSRPQTNPNTSRSLHSTGASGLSPTCLPGLTRPTPPHSPPGPMLPLQPRLCRPNSATFSTTWSRTTAAGRLGDATGARVRLPGTSPRVTVCTQATRDASEAADGLVLLNHSQSSGAVCACAHVSACVYVCMCVRVCEHVCTCVRVHVCLCASVSVLVQVSILVSTHVCVCMCTSVCARV